MKKFWVWFAGIIFGCTGVFLALLGASVITILTDFAISIALQFIGWHWDEEI